MIKRLPWGFTLPPIVALAIAAGVVQNQSARHARISAELREARHEVSRLSKLLPKGEVVPANDADHCDDGNHVHG